MYLMYFPLQTGFASSLFWTMVVKELSLLCRWCALQCPSVLSHCLYQCLCSDEHSTSGNKMVLSFLPETVLLSPISLTPRSRRESDSPFPTTKHISEVAAPRILWRHFSYIKMDSSLCWPSRLFFWASLKGS